MFWQAERGSPVEGLEAWEQFDNTARWFYNRAEFEAQR